jgi:Holliday junction resolvase RusA-like endonuclease
MRFTVPGKAQPKKRPRVVRTPKGVHTYTPDELGYAPQVQARALEAGVKVLDGPVYLSMLIHRRMPAGFSRKKRIEMEGKLTIVRPDPINVAMLYCDALSGIAWHDDSQVHLRFVEQRWATVDEVLVDVTSPNGESPREHIDSQAEAAQKAWD